MTPPTQEYRTIPLTQGQVALIDADDYAKVNKYQWQAAWNRGSQSYYAKASINRNGRKTTLLMHRLVMGLDFGDCLQVDHKEPELTLDNRKSNLRVTNAVGNGRNKGASSNSKSGLKGIAWRKRDNMYEAYIRIGEGRRIYLGHSPDPQTAHDLYCKAAKLYHREFARFK